MTEAYRDEKPSGLNQRVSLQWSPMNLQQMRIWSVLMQLRSRVRPVTEVINDPSPCCHCGCHTCSRNRQHWRWKSSQAGKRAGSFSIKNKLLLTLKLWFWKTRGIDVGEHGTKTRSSVGTAQCWGSSDGFLERAGGMHLEYMERQILQEAHWSKTWIHYWLCK